MRRGLGRHSFRSPGGVVAAAPPPPPSGDSNFRYVTLLMPGDGTNGAQNNTFLDSSTNAFSITRNGNTTQGTFSPYGSNWSNYFDGTGDFLSIADNVALQMGSGAFTLEAWVFRGASGAAHTIFAKGGASTGLVLGITSTNVLRFTDTTTNIDSTGTIPVGTWTHVAAVREGTGTNQLKLYINGSNDGTGTSATNFTQTEQFQVGRDRSATSDFNGYISNARVVKGTAVYTGNFTPSTTPLTAITNTSLLTCQSNRFIDNSTNNFTITRNGDVSVQRFSPFSPTTSYSASTIGGSGYFDGTGDYLVTPSNTALNIGTGDFTAECWAYPATPVGEEHTGLFLTISGGSPQWQYFDTATRNLGAPVYGQWSHVAVSRTASVVSIYINGTRVYTGSDTSNKTQSSFTIGARSDGSYIWNGYLSNMRLIKGTGIYSGTTITVPTAPLTAITNTQLLLNFTNAGIIDNAMLNDAETVGNAQISTAQSKFGGSSIYFDGAGDRLTVVGVSSSGAYNQMTASGKVNTIEMWLYVNAFTSPRSFLVGSWINTPSEIGWTYDLTTSGDIFVGNNTAGSTITLSTKITTATWHHLAFVNNGTTITVYLNGNNVGSIAVLTPTSYIGPLSVGQRADNTLSCNAYIDDLRITNGVARYTANFTPPTAPFPTQ